MPFLNPSSMPSTSKSTLISRPQHLKPTPTPTPPLASLLHLRPLSTPSQSLSRSLRLSPRTRTRLQNISFLTATLVSIVTVSLAMSGSAGVELPCPARQGVKVGMQDEGKDWGFGSSTGTGSGTKKKRWLDEPVVVPQRIPKGNEGQQRTGPRMATGEGRD